MDKKLQDLVWPLLPKEFKKEVKKYYHTLHEQYIDYAGFHLENAKAKVQERITTLEYFFGIHNLTSDLEEEEMLTVKAKTIREMYAANERIMIDFRGKIDAINSDLINHVLRQLFGSKCLPDNVDSLSQNSPENCDNGNLISADDSKPAEPRFEVGQFAMYKGRRVEIIDYSDHSPQLYRVFVLTENYHTDADESELEPYTEPEENVNLSQETANCDKHFDNILKDSFSKERRLNIAATILAGIMAGGAQARHPVRRALELADALIIESVKGGSDGK